MSWFSNTLNNPNVHIAVGTIAGVASSFFPAWAVPLAAVAGVFGATGIALPEHPVAVPPVVIPPVVSPPTSLHQADYANIVTSVLAGLAQQAAATQAAKQPAPPIPPTP